MELKRVYVTGRVKRTRSPGHRGTSHTKKERLASSPRSGMLQGMLILLLAAGLAAAFQDAPLVEVESLKTQGAPCSRPPRDRACASATCVHREATLC